jgi:Spy/CpxP family protein refolding chaperone
MKMKSYTLLPALICGVIVAITPALRAQDAPAAAPAASPAAAPEKGQHKGGDIVARLTTDLSLTDDQQTKVKAIVADSHTKMQAIKGDTTLTDDQKKAKGKDIRDAQTAAIKAILTPDQATKYDALQQKWQANRKGGQGS